ncbi:vascular endothelial growth factor A-like [Ptychodera flava]|uniref:vascular endothelial growth factor A-like n=1 Tax=Ptychodera flava TaxID=63121 RepID=UPI00396A4338
MWSVLVLLLAIVTGTTGRASSIPPSILFKMRSVKTAEDFVRLFHRPSIPDEGIPGKGDGIPPVRPEVPYGKDDEHENDYAFDMIAVPPPCQPRPTSVPVPPNSDPYVLYWPPCVELHRCGGCCSSELFTCEASATHNVDVKVYRARSDPTNEDAVPIERIETFKMTNETQCKCDCKVKPHDCNLAIHRHEYCQCVCIQKEHSCPARKVWDDRTCGCVCRKPAQERNCFGRNRIWRESTCQCECRAVLPCRPSFAWHPSKCKCEKENKVKIYLSQRCLSSTSCPLGQNMSNDCICKRSLSRLPGIDELQQE